MNKVINAIKEHIANSNVCFVFPSQPASDQWARKTCTLGITRSVAATRFMAWDDFKKEVISEQGALNTPASAVIRKLFADALIRKNLNLKPNYLFKSLIPPEYAEGGGVFAPFIARLLPSLAYWEKLAKHLNQDRNYDEEDEDYSLLKHEYQSFLTRHGLFEPSWEEREIRKGDKRYALFFPELIEDFTEYDALLTTPQFIRINSEPAHGGGAGQNTLRYFQSAREEIRTAVTELKRLHEEEGIPYEDMAISVPELEEMEPCLLKELFLYHIPVTRRAGKKLGETGAGMLFPLLNEYAASRFSFGSLKALILNDHIPWKDREKNKTLIRFGIKYNCVSSYVQNGTVIDIWEEAFKGAGEKELQSHYRKLKNSIMAFIASKSFKELMKCYFIFRGEFLDMENISEQDDAVLSRCIVELASLIELEEKLNDPELVPASPFGFYISCINETGYVRNEKKKGINIYPWRVAAATPFSCHFVLNASQGAASVLYQPMKFLRQDKRKILGLEDRDATGAFFSLCDTGEEVGFKTRLRISASAQTFSGWAIPHSFFAQGKTEKTQVSPQKNSKGIPEGLSADPYVAERLFWKELGKAGNKAEGVQLPTIFPLQKNSYETWKNTLAQNGNNFSFFRSSVSVSSPVNKMMQSAILGDDGLLAVTPTNDLNVFYDCTIKWLYKRIFSAEEFSLEAALLDDTSLGILYHNILETLFYRIKTEDRTFNLNRLDTYKTWALEATKSEIKEHPAFRGPLAIPLVSPQATGIAKKISNILELEAQAFNNYEIAELEYPVSYKTEELNIKGIIDRVSISPEGEAIIIDYKTSYLPDQISAENLGEVPLTEFQMPLYIKLYEELSAAKHGEDYSKTAGAYFYSINGHKIKTVMGKSTGRTKAPDRKEYEPFLKAAEDQIAEFAQKVKALDFVPSEIRVKDCFECVYKTICRSAYFLNSGN